MTDDTPPDEFPARRANGEHATIDPVWFHEWRRDQDRTLREIRKEHREALAEIGQRLSGIEGKIAEGEHATDKHDQQIAELASEAAETHRRVEKLEREGSSVVVLRVEALERKDDAREKAEAKAAALAEASAQSAGKRLLGSLLDGAARSLGPIIVGFLSWLIFTYARAAPVPAAPSPASAHP